MGAASAVLSSAHYDRPELFGEGHWRGDFVRPAPAPVRCPRSSRPLFTERCPGSTAIDAGRCRCPAPTGCRPGETHSDARVQYRRRPASASLTRTAPLPCQESFDRRATRAPGVEHRFVGEDDRVLAFLQLLHLLEGPRVHEARTVDRGGGARPGASRRHAPTTVRERGGEPGVEEHELGPSRGDPGRRLSSGGASRSSFATRTVIEALALGAPRSVSGSAHGLSDTGLSCSSHPRRAHRFLSYAA